MIRFAFFLVVFLFAATASAQRCGDEARAWIDRCARSSGIAMELEACPASIAVIATKNLRVEISMSPNAFLHAGAYGVSPIGDFADWKLEPEARRNALQAVAHCAEVDPPVSLLSGSDSASVGFLQPAHAPRPWLLAIATALSIVACVRRSRATLLALGAVALIFFAQRWLQPFAFFHQNGQGPLWIEFAYRGDAGEYGPGYPEIFGFFARARRPETGVIALQGLLAATVPLSAYAIARAVCAGRRVSLALGAILALDPVLLRVARSESYFSVIGALIFASAAVLASTDRRHRLLGLVGSALFIAQAARVHPLAWVPSALVPLVLSCRPGRLLERAKRTMLAMAVIGAIVAPFLIGPMRAVLHGELGTGFIPGARALIGARGAIVLPFLAVVVLLAFVPSLRRVGPRLAVLGGVFVVAFLADILKNDSAVVHAAHLHLFVPAALAAIAAVSSRLVSPTRSTVLTASIGLLGVVHIVMERPLLILPTDARELGWALEWRERLPPGADVASLSRVGSRLLRLPLLGAGLPTWSEIDENGNAGGAGATARYYYRSSLCSTSEGEPVCARFESAHRLRGIESRRFPSIESLPWEPLPPGEIEVGLFVVE